MGKDSSPQPPYCKVNGLVPYNGCDMPSLMSALYDLGHDRLTVTSLKHSGTCVQESGIITATFPKKALLSVAAHNDSDASTKFSF